MFPLDNQTIGNIQLNDAWNRYFALDKKINDRVAQNMYNALKQIVYSKKLKPLQQNDQKSFDKCYDAMVQYEISYNKN
jgi:hypothetical protein